MQYFTTWGMRFNAKKCYMMTIARARHPRTHIYSLNNHILQTVDQEKYLGINISNDLNWSAHINNNTNKSNSKLGFLRRDLKRCPHKLKETAYITLVRSTLEYAGSVWDPRLAKDRQSLEKIQRKAARFVKRDYRRRSSPTRMMAGLGWRGWRDLETRRRDMRLTLLHKIIINNIAITTADLGMAAGDGRTKSNHARKLIESHGGTNSTAQGVICCPHHPRVEQATGYRSRGSFANSLQGSAGAPTDQLLVGQAVGASSSSLRDTPSAVV